MKKGRKGKLNERKSYKEEGKISSIELVFALPSRQEGSSDIHVEKEKMRYREKSKQQEGKIFSLSSFFSSPPPPGEGRLG